MFDRLRESFIGQQNRPERTGIPGLPELAASHGWRKLPEDPNGDGAAAFDDSIHERVTDIVVSHVGRSPRARTSMARFHDAYTGEFGGHRFVVANAWTNDDSTWVTATAALQISDQILLPMLMVDPRRPHLIGGGRLVPVDPVFDQSFEVVAVPPEAVGLLSAPVQQLLMTHPDWRLWTRGTCLVVVSFQPYQSVGDVTAMLSELVAIADAMPAAALPSLDEHYPGMPAGIRIRRGMFDGGIDGADLQRQMDALPPDQQAQVMAAFEARRQRHKAEMAARRAEQQKRR